MTPPPELARFDRVERAAHWSTATLFGVLMFTGAALYAGPISTLVGQREVVRTIHVGAGLLLPLPLLVGLVGRWGRALRVDLRRLGRFDDEDRVWLHRGTRDDARLGKFNPGQKLNAAFLGSAIVVMLGTGIVLKWFSLFSLTTRTGATFVHDWVALGIWVSVLGHIMLALRDPDALRGMLYGAVPIRWARLHRPGWYEAETGEPATRLKPPEPAPAATEGA
ncbi:MAG TPA: cytochrome b/b6 domain-containing protein [Acidimicrobiia bacterium]|nr:cytochrome b/b6 domain-containing protein [Acidimicrobiia bacterium]